MYTYVIIKLLAQISVLLVLFAGMSFAWSIDVYKRGVKPKYWRKYGRWAGYLAYFDKTKVDQEYKYKSKKIRGLAKALLLAAIVTFLLGLSVFAYEVLV